MKRSLFALSIVMLVLLQVPAWGNEELNYNVINLQAEATGELANDILVVTLSAMAEDNSAHLAAQTVNQIMSWALPLIKEKQEVKLSTTQYHTAPIYKNRIISGWSVRQQVRLESSKVDELSSLTGVLQQKLAVTSMQFEASPERRDAAVNGLIDQALARFHEKAKLISTSLKAQDYRLINISVSENRPPAPYRKSFQAESMAAQAVAPPQVEAGESDISVNVAGSIQLVF